MKRKVENPDSGLGGEESPLNGSVGQSEPTSLARRDGGLGSSRTQENSLIMQLRYANGYKSTGEGITMRRYEDLDPGESGDDAATAVVLQRIAALANFREGDFAVSEQASRLAQKQIRKYRKRCAELTRKGIHKIVISVLRQCWLDFGPARVRLQPAVLLEVLDGI